MALQLVDPVEELKVLEGSLLGQGSRRPEWIRSCRAEHQPTTVIADLGREERPQLSPLPALPSDARSGEEVSK